MGNCLIGGFGDHPTEGIVKVVTSNGGIMEFPAPIAAGFITDEFPGHGIFRGHDVLWKPLAGYEELQAGEAYYLLPFNVTGNKLKIGDHVIRRGHMRSSSIPMMSTPFTATTATPYRMSVDYQGTLKRSYTEVFFRDGSKGNNNNTTKHGSKNNKGVWKVKLVICPEQLMEILSQETRTQELIESVRAVAKCGKGGTSTTTTSSCGNSDQWSRSSSRNNGSSKMDGLVEI